MAKTFSFKKKLFLVAAVGISTCAMSGCIESSFNLAHESRLPQGVALPPGLIRNDATITLDFIGTSQAKFTLRDKTGKKLATVKGKTKGSVVYLSTNPPKIDSTGPSYQIVVINSVTEIMECIPYREHAGMVQNGKIVALFNVIDDPSIRREVLACKQRMGRECVRFVQSDGRLG